MSQSNVIVPSTSNTWLMNKDLQTDQINKDWDILKQSLKRLKKARKQINQAIVTLESGCPHLETVPGSRYFSATYNDNAYTQYFDRCVVCNKSLNVRDEFLSSQTV